MGIFAQVWFWSALAFVAGALLSWALLALPARRQLAQQDRTADAESVSRPLRQPVPPLPERRYDDDPLDRRRSPFDEHPGDRRQPSPFDDEPGDDRRLPSPFDDESDERRSQFDGPSPFEQDTSGPDDDEDYDLFPSPTRRDPEPAARTELMPGVDTGADEDDDAADRGLLGLSGGQSSVSPPTVRVPVSGLLDEGGPFAPPEPPLPGRPVEDEAAATQFLPAIAPEPVREIEAPPEVGPDGKRGWFDETGADAGSEASHEDDGTLVDDLAVDPRQAESSELVDDVEDIEQPADTGGTIFTQRTQPVSGDLISSLDGKPAPDTAAPESSQSSKQDVTETVVDAEPVEPSAPSSASHPTTVLPVRKPGANRFDTGSRSRPSPPKPSPSPSPAPAPAPARETEATQAMPAAAAAPAPEPAEPERARSLFEPIVPADESVTTSMPAPAAAPTKTGDGKFVPPGPFGPGSAMPLPGGGSPSPEFTVKASVTALRYCEPDSPLFGRTVAEVWFRTTKDAERVGFRPLS